MSGLFCENCGSKLNKNSNFCSLCGYKLQNESNKRDEKEAILSLSHSSKKTIVNIALWVLFGMFSVSFYIIVFMLAFRWENVTNLIFEDYDGSSFTLLVLLPVGYLLGVMVISKLFKNLKASKTIVKITFITSLFMIGTFSIHILSTLFIYFNSARAIEAVLGFYPQHVGYYQQAIIDESQYVLQSKMSVLLINILAAIGFITLMLGRYFKKHSLGFGAGFKSLMDGPNIIKFKGVFKQLD